MDTQLLILGGGFAAFLLLVMVALIGPSSGKAGTRRLEGIRDRHTVSREAAMEAQMRKTIAHKVPSGSQFLANLLPNRTLLQKRLQRTGKDWQLNKFLMINVAIFIMTFSLLKLIGAGFLLAIFAAAFVGLALPHFYVGRLIKKRVKKFIASFPDGIDLLVRGLRSGLPVSETLGVVATEIPGPVGEEFKTIVERIKIGRSMEGALQDAADTLDTPEFQFFCITLAIQRETGGNLAETLSNLSEVLRKRAQMKLKIRALSSEAKASAYIVGALPFFVFAIITYMNPDYTSGFFSNPELMGIGIGGLVWMGIGVGIMAKMISFEI